MSRSFKILRSFELVSLEHFACYSNYIFFSILFLLQLSTSLKSNFFNIYMRIFRFAIDLIIINFLLLYLRLSRFENCIILFCRILQQDN